MNKIKSWFGNSLTMFGATVVSGVSLVLENIDLVASDSIKSQLLDAGFDPVTVGRTGLALGLLTLAARFRSLRK